MSHTEEDTRHHLATDSETRHDNDNQEQHTEGERDDSELVAQRLWPIL